MGSCEANAANKIQTAHTVFTAKGCRPVLKPLICNRQPFNYLLYKLQQKSTLHIIAVKPAIALNYLR
jgi:hypothetical protein